MLLISRFPGELPPLAWGSSPYSRRSRPSSARPRGRPDRHFPIQLQDQGKPVAGVIWTQGLNPDRFSGNGLRHQNAIIPAPAADQILLKYLLWGNIEFAWDRRKAQSNLVKPRRLLRGSPDCFSG